jgi:hypothetical protein
MSINAYRRKFREQPTSPSKRWQTTAQSAMQEIADQISHSDRAFMVQDLKDRKINNTKTSISFGNDKVGNFMVVLRFVFRLIFVSFNRTGFVRK